VHSRIWCNSLANYKIHPTHTNSRFSFHIVDTCINKCMQIIYSRGWVGWLGGIDGFGGEVVEGRLLGSVVDFEVLVNSNTVGCS
jgi:hypothetical protein